MFKKRAVCLISKEGFGLVGAFPLRFSMSYATAAGLAECMAQKKGAKSKKTLCAMVVVLSAQAAKSLAALRAERVFGASET